MWVLSCPGWLVTQEATTDTQCGFYPALAGWSHKRLQLTLNVGFILPWLAGHTRGYN